MLPVPTAALAQDQLVAAFLSGRSPQTLRAYRQDLEAFRLFSGSPTASEAVRLLIARGPAGANTAALAWRNDLLQRGLGPATINRRLAALRSLIKLARLLGMASFTLEVENLRVTPYRDTRGPGPDGFRLLLEAASGTTPKSLRDQAILRLLYDLALRRAEVVSLNVSDVDLNASRLTILGKGRLQVEHLTLPDPTRAALAAWLAVRGLVPGPLFLNFDRARKGQRLTGTGLYLIIRALGRKAGFSVRPHGLRHAGITAALDLTNGNLRAVQRYSRHKDPRILTVYDDNRTDLAGEVARLVASGGGPPSESP